ncbi:protein kinase-like domain, concanavalin A-like lectin/glucanase domain protein, partial [Tanacetum coccineum]
KMILAIATLRNGEGFQMDVKMAFLNGDLEKVQYMNQPEGFMDPGLESKVDLGSIIDSGLSEVILGKPFVHTSKLTYDESLGLIRFSQKDDEVVFRMPQKTKELDLVSSLEKDKFEAFFVESLKVRKKEFKHVLEKRKGYYKAYMNLGRTYKRDRETIEKLKTNHISIIQLKE